MLSMCSRQMVWLRELSSLYAVELTCKCMRACICVWACSECVHAYAHGRAARAVPCT